MSLEIERLPRDNMVEFRVADTGIGIKEADLANVFDEFITVDTDYARENPGTGLGLDHPATRDRHGWRDRGRQHRGRGPSSPCAFVCRPPATHRTGPRRPAGQTFGGACGTAPCEDNDINRMTDMLGELHE